MGVLKRLAALLVCVALLAGATAFAEADATLKPSDNFLDMQVRIGKKVYTFNDTVQGIEDQGLRYDSEIKAGYWTRVNNGRLAFSVLLDALDRDNATRDQIYACGYKLYAKETPDAEMPKGIVLGSATRKDVLAAYGDPNNDWDDRIRYTFFRHHLNLLFYFDGEGEDAAIDRVECDCTTPLLYGLEVSELAGVVQDDLPDPTTMSFDQFILDGKFYEGKFTVQDLIDNGWRISLSDVDETASPRGNFITTLTGLTLFNGKTFIRAYVYNDKSTEDGCPVAKADVASVGVNIADLTDIVLADGITLGSTLDDVVATYGSNYEVSEERTGDVLNYTKYSFSMNNIQTRFNVIDDKVVYIEVQTGI